MSDKSRAEMIVETFDNHSYRIEKVLNREWINSLEQLHLDMRAILSKEGTTISRIYEAEMFNETEMLHRGGLLMIKQLRHYLDKVKEDVK